MSKEHTVSTVIYNGPSAGLWRNFLFPGPVWGCNFAYRDWPLTYCWAVDRMTVAKIRGELEGRALPCEMWTKKTSLELPSQWQHRETPGIDSGSAAVSHCLTLTQGPVIIIGADGICGGSTVSHYQQEYLWHPTERTRPKIHLRHRQTLIELDRQWPGRLVLCWPEPLDFIKTIDHKSCLDLYSKYTTRTSQ